MGPKTIAAMVLVVVFALGGVAGYVLHGHLGAPARAVTFDAVSGAELHARAMGELRQQLGLTDEQVAAIEAIVQDRQEIVQHMWEQLRPQVQAAMSEVHAEIAALLSPEQRERFHAWLQQQRQAHEVQVHEPQPH